MTGTLVEITLKSAPKFFSVLDLSERSFNNDSAADRNRNSFCKALQPFDFHSRQGQPVPSRYLQPNVHHYNSDEIYKLKDSIVVGEYCNQGVIVPRSFSISFNQLYNCTPLISLIKGDMDYLSFLHTWAIPEDYDVVDRQVKHWMQRTSDVGDIVETIFAPRKGCGADTTYTKAIDHITAKSQKTIVLTRGINQIVGVTNTSGVYFKSCGYHLWES